jgi:hypothetical protein
MAASNGDWRAETPATQGTITGTNTEGSTLIRKVTPDSHSPKAAIQVTETDLKELQVDPAYFTDRETPRIRILHPNGWAKSDLSRSSLPVDDDAPCDQNNGAMPDVKPFAVLDYRREPQPPEQLVTAPSIAGMASRAQGNTEATTTENQAIAQATIPDEEIRQGDILLGRGRHLYTRPGNLYYNDWLVPRYQASYKLANKIEKREIAQALVHQATILEGRRFIKLNDDRTWSLAPLDEVLEKVQRSLRNK